MRHAMLSFINSPLLLTVCAFYCAEMQLGEMFLRSKKQHEIWSAPGGVGDVNMGYLTSAPLAVH